MSNELKKLIKRQKGKRNLKDLDINIQDVISDYKLEDLINLSQIQKLFEKQYKFAELPVGLLDLDNNILVGVGWQDICVNFHRKNNNSAKLCSESDSYIKENLGKEKYVGYKCNLGLWDVGVPIKISGHYMGNLFFGQFFYEDDEEDVKYFKKQAKKFGYDEKEYLKALKKVPRISRRRVRDIMQYYSQLVKIITEEAEQNLFLRLEIEARKNMEEILQSKQAEYFALLENIPQKIFYKDTKLNYIICNDEYAKDLKINKDEIRGKNDFDFYPIKLAEKYRRDDRKVLKSKKIYDQEERYELNGQEYFVHSVKAPVKSKDGKVIGLYGIFWDITEEKNKSALLDKHRDFLQSIYEGAELPMFVLDVTPNKEFVFQGLNPAHERLTGMKSSDVEGKKPEELTDLPVEARKAVKANYTRCLKAGKPIQYQETIPMKGKLTHWLTTLTPLKDTEGKIYRIVGTAMFINNLVEAEEKLRSHQEKLEQTVEERTKQLADSEERYKLAAEATNQGIWDWDVKSNEVFYSNTWKKQIGYKGNELENSFDIWIDHLHPDDKDRCMTAVQQYLENPKGKFILEFRFRHKKGHYIWIHNQAASKKDDKGKITRMFGTHTDITKQKEAEEKLKESEAKYKTLTESSKDQIFIIDKEMKVQYVNKTAAKSFKDKPQNLIGKSISELFPPQIAQNQIKALNSVIDKRVSTSSVTEAKFPGGSRWLNTDLIPLKSNGNDVDSVMGVSRDVTEQKKAEQIITEEKEFTDSVINAMPGIFYLFDQNGKFVMWNNTLTELSGIPTEEVGNRSPLDFIAPHDREKIGKAIQTAFTEGEVFVEADFLVEGDKAKPFYFTGIRIIRGNVPLLLGVGIDISIQKQAELAKDKALEELKERWKEMMCLYQIGEVLRSDEMSLENLFNKIVEMIPHGWYKPELTGAIIRFDDIEVRSENVKNIDKFDSELTSSIEVDKVTRGEIIVGLINTNNGNSDVRFLEEEKSLLQNIKNNIANYINRIEFEKALIESEEQFRKMLQQSPLPIVITDLEGNVEFLNGSFKDIIGYKIEEMPNVEDWWPIAYPDEKYMEEVKNTWETELNQAIQENRASKPVEARIVCKDGAERIFTTIGSRIGDKILIIFNDLTERIKAEEERDRFFKVSLDLLCIAGTDGFFRRMNPSWEKTLGWTREELMSKPFLNFIHPDDIEPTIKEVEKLKDGRPSVNFVNRYLHKDGTYRWLNWVSAPFGDTLYASATDITELKAAQDEILKSEERFRSVYNDSPVSIWEEDWTEIIEMIDNIKNDGVNDFENYFNSNQDFVDKALTKVKIVDVNKATLEMFKAKDKDDLVNSLKVVFATEDTLQGFIGELIALAEGKLVYETEMKLNTVDGDIIETLLRMTFPAENSVTGQVLVSIMDITQLKKAEKKMLQIMEELKRSNQELEQFAYVASHDLQEPLRMVSSYTQLLERRYSDKLDENARDFIGFAVDGASRMQNLISDLLQFSRITTRGGNFEEEDLNRLLSFAQANLQQTIEETEAVVISDKLPELNVDSQQIIRLFQNLIGNGIKYRREESPKINISCQENYDHYQFKIEDNGLGIADKFKEKIFIIFQRLHDKSKYEGTGIGLAICKRIVERHGGEIWVESEEGKGSSFIFTLKKGIK